MRKGVFNQRGPTPLKLGNIRSVIRSNFDIFTCWQIMSDKRIVLLALDGSKHADYSFTWFLTKCLRPGDHLIGFTVWQNPHLPTFSLKAPFKPPTEDWEKIMSEVRKQVQKIDNDFSSVCQARKVPYEFLDKCDSNPGEAIVSMAKEKKAELLVMGTRGLSTLRRTVLGSVSDYVLHHTDCPIAVVPTPEDSTQAAASS